MGTPFAMRWSLTLILGPSIYLLYLVMKKLVPLLFGLPIVQAYPILMLDGPALIFLGAMFLMQRRFCFADISFVGTYNRKSIFCGIIAVTVVYLANYAWTYLSGQPREPSMVSLYRFKTDIQVIVLVISLLLLPPIVEELAFRHFILATLPFNANALTRWIAIIATALFFVHEHRYIYPTTNVLIFALAVIFGFARTHSGGLLLPIGLHAYAIALGLTCNQIAAYLES
jgi:uncharacterized protein